MKISNASKKVLASALSAAMVVAFAPTVAFGKTGDAINVTVNLDGGVAAAGETTTFANALVGDVITLPAATKAGYAVDSWKVKYEGAADFTDLTDFDSDNSNGIQAKLADKKSVEFKAVYDTPSASTEFTAGTAGVATGSTIVATFDGANKGKLVAGKQYTLKVTGPTGKVLATSAKFGSTISADVTATATFGAGADQIDPEFLVGGTYVTTIADEDGNVVFTSDKDSSLGITQLNVKDTTDAKTDAVLFATAGADTTVLNGATYVDAEGYSIDNAGVKALKAGVYDVKKVAASKTVSVTPVAYDATARTIGFTPTYASGVPAKGSIETAVVDPSGKTIWSATDSAATAMTATFKQGTSVASFAGAAETAGDYVYTATVKNEDGEVVATGKAKVTLTQVVYVAGEGVEFKDNSAATGTNYTKAENQSFWTSGTATAAAITTVAKAKAGYTLATAWQLDGKDLSAANAIAAGKVNTLTATAKVTDVSMNCVDPTIESASFDATKKEWTIKLACATAGAKLVWGTTSSLTTAYDATKGIVTKAETIHVQALPVKGSTPANITTQSNVVELTCVTSDWSDFASTTGAVYKKVGKSASTYADAPDVKAALEAGDAAVKAAGYKTAKDMKALIDGNAKAVYTAVKAYAEAELAAYANGALVVVGDKAYTMDAKTLAAKQKAIATATKDVKDSTDAAGYKALIKTIVTDTNAALNAAVEDKTVTAADVTAAKALNAAIAALPAEVTAANGNDVIAATDKILADYAALTTGAKKLVSSADYAKAVATIKAADEAIANADKAAVAKVKGKTVKAKAKKATKSSLKAVTSESGAKSTFKKVTKNSKVTVSKTGKIVVKKGLKAGKKYTVKVKATVGASTKTVKVVVKVAK